jgi:hypothetical protein
VRAGDILPEQLDAALGNGPALTALVRGAKSNPHRAVEFKNAWDALEGR